MTGDFLYCIPEVGFDCAVLGNLNEAEFLSDDVVS